MNHPLGDAYNEFIECRASVDEGLVFIKVVAMPYQGAVEFDVTQARAFAATILEAVALVESGWAGTPRTSSQGSESA